MATDKNKKPTHPPIDILFLLGFLAICLVLFQYTTLAKFASLPPAKHFVTFTNFLAALPHYNIRLNSLDFLIAGIIATISLMLILLEITKKRLTYFFAYILKSNRRTSICLISIAFISVRFYFAPGSSSWAADTSLHTIYVWIASQIFAQWQWPIWNNLFTAGSPYLQFYGFLFFYITGLLDQLVDNHFTSIKIILALSHVCSGLSMYVFVRALTQSRRASFFSALAYILCFWHTQQVLMMGRLPLSIFYALLPLPFYALEKLRTPNTRYAFTLTGALTLAALTFTHPGYGFWATAFFALYATLRYGLNPSQFPIKYLLLLFFGGLVFGSYLTLPMWLEKGATGLNTGFSMTHVADPNWQQLVLWSNHRFAFFATEATHQHWYGGYLGITLILLTFIGIVALFYTPKHRSYILPLSICLIGSLILIFGYRWPVLRSLPIVQALNAGRYLLFVTFFMSAITGLSILWFTQLTRHKMHIFTAIFIVTILDLFPTTFQHPYLTDSPNDPALAILSTEHYQALKSDLKDVPHHQLPTSRIFHTTTQTYPAVLVAWFTQNLRLPTYHHLYNELPLAGANFILPFAKAVMQELGPVENMNTFMQHPNWQTIIRGFYLLNTRHVLIHQPANQQTLKWRLPNHSPIIVSNKAVPFQQRTSENNLQAHILHAYGALNDQMRQCDQIPLLNFPQTQTLDIQPKIDILNHTKEYQYVQLRVHLSHPGYARLSYAYYPYLQVYVNGERVEPFETPDHFIALKLNAGEQTIELVPTLSILRKSLLAINITLLVLAVVFIRKHHRST